MVDIAIFDLEQFPILTIVDKEAPHASRLLARYVRLLSLS